MFYDGKIGSPEPKLKVKPSNSITNLNSYNPTYESSNKRDYKPFSKRSSTPNHKKSFEFIPTSYSPDQFISMSRKTFTGSNSAFKDPHMLRKRALVN